MHGLNKSEMVRFREIKALARISLAAADADALAWLREAQPRSAKRMLRAIALRCVKFLFANSTMKFRRTT